MGFMLEILECDAAVRRQMVELVYSRYPSARPQNYVNATAGTDEDHPRHDVSAELRTNVDRDEGLYGVFADIFGYLQARNDDDDETRPEKDQQKMGAMLEILQSDDEFFQQMIEFIHRRFTRATPTDYINNEIKRWTAKIYPRTTLTFLS